MSAVAKLADNQPGVVFAHDVRSDSQNRRVDPQSRKHVHSDLAERSVTSPPGPTLVGVSAYLGTDRECAWVIVLYYSSVSVYVVGPCICNAKVLEMDRRWWFVGR